jgi:hypothetical protein
MLAHSRVPHTFTYISFGYDKYGEDPARRDQSDPLRDVESTVDERQAASLLVWSRTEQVFGSRSHTALLALAAQRLGGGTMVVERAALAAVAAGLVTVEGRVQIVERQPDREGACEL